MKREDHEAHCVEVLGLPFTEVHVYLDQYFPLFRSGLHRCVLHHRKGVDKIVRLYGPKYGYEGGILVRQAAILHIMDDMGFVAEEPSDLEDYQFFLNDGDEREFEHCLSLEFP